MKKNFLIWFNMALILLDIIGLVVCYGEKGFGLFVYYTQLSNIVALLSSICLVICLLKDKYPKWIRIFRHMSASVVSVTFVVVVFVLAPINTDGYMDSFLGGSSLYHHTICPIMMFISYVFLEKGETLRLKDVSIALIPTIAYAVVMIILNTLKMVYGPYPFLRVYEQSVYASILWTIAIIGLAYILALFIWFISEKINKKSIMRK